MKKFLVFLLLLPLLQYANAQKPPHLVPLAISELVPVEIDFEKECQESYVTFHPDTYIRFIECRNPEGTVGYLLEPKDCLCFSFVFLGHLQFGDCCKVGLKEVQRAETMFAKLIDKRVDAAHEVVKVFTAPYFYQYIRQYAFCINSEGDTCVHVNCIHISEVIPEEKFCKNRMRPDIDYIHVCDGGDYFWNVYLNLTKGKLLDYSVNGPNIYYVEGRNKEPRGLCHETVFNHLFWPISENYGFDQLPTAVKETVSSQISRTKIDYCEYFSTKYIWKYREKKNGNHVSKRKRYKKGDYYRICSDSICRGYNVQGQLLYVGNSEFGRLEQKHLSHIAEIDTMMAAIKLDMSLRGNDYDRYGYIKWVEQVGDHYVFSVIYDPPIHADFMFAYYTFDAKGQVKGVCIE